MFFSLTAQTKSNFANCYSLGKINLYTDSGWHTDQVDHYRVVYKGYADGVVLGQDLQSILMQSQPEHTGNFCVIAHDLHSGMIIIRNDRWRSFPLYIHAGEITNLTPSRRVAWADSMISIDQMSAVTERKFDAIGSIDTLPLDQSQVIDRIEHILRYKTQQFLAHNHWPIKAHLSGGVDSLLVYSLLLANGADVELITCQHFDYDRFWLLNDSQILTNWGYRQLHHWNYPCVLTSGAPGDEFMLRSPTTLDLWLKYHGLSTIEQLAQRPQCLHSDYFHKPTHVKLFQEQSVDRTRSKDQFCWDLCNMVVNDWQHWHLGQTLTWTPLRDLEIFKLLLRLDVQAAMDQMFDSALSKQLIERLCPGLTQYISHQKNSTNPMRNLVPYLFKIPNSSGQ